MLFDPVDAPILKWAIEQSAPWYYTREPDVPQPCLKVHCGHLTAYFSRGRLHRLWAHADTAALDDMFSQLVDLFGLVARLEHNSEAEETSQDYIAVQRFAEPWPHVNG